MASRDPLDDLTLPEYVRRCHEYYVTAMKDVLDTSTESRKMWLGGKHQWRDGEIASRTGENLPWISINLCKPAVDQIENEARNNPPGPEARPVGGGADKDGADILEGIIREYEYRCNSPKHYITGLRYSCAGNYGVFELGTEFAGPRSMTQRLVTKEAPDPDCYFVDPDAREMCRQDAMWAGKLRVLSRDKVIEEFGDNLKILDRNLIDRAAGWMQSALGWRGNQASINLWTGGGQGQGPYYVCEFYKVKTEREKLTLWTDGIGRYKDEMVPDGVTPMLDADGEPVGRMETRRYVKKYVVTALDIISETDWLGTIIPYFWILGPEMWVKGKLYRLSLIDGAMDSQRGLNYAATSAVEVVSTMTKAPFIGWQGQFDTPNAQGMNPWETSNTKRWAYMEVKPTYAINPSTGMSELLATFPQRNQWEAPIGRLLELCQFFGERIKSATAIWFDPSQQKVSDNQSGEAIRALQQQTNIGTLNWQDTMRMAVSLSYQQAALIARKLYPKEMVVAIVRPDTEHEMQVINRDFGASGIDPETGKRGKRNSITGGEYSVRVSAGASFKDRMDKALVQLMNLIPAAPQLTQVPGVLAQIIRMVGEGNPEMEAVADMLLPAGDDDLTPAQLQQQIIQLKASDEQKTALIQQMSQVIMSKLPELMAKEKINVRDNLTRLHVAEIAATKGADNAEADRQAAMLEAEQARGHDAAKTMIEHAVTMRLAAQQPRQETQE